MSLVIKPVFLCKAVFYANLFLINFIFDETIYIVHEQTIYIYCVSIVVDQTYKLLKMNTYEREQTCLLGKLTFSKSFKLVL